MDWQAALRARLLDDATVASLVADRVYWSVAPQDAAFPRITLTLVFTQRVQTMKGVDPLQAARVQFDAWALSHKDAYGLGEAIWGAIAQPGGNNGIRFLRPMPEAALDLDEQDEVQTVFRKSQDIAIWWSVEA